MAYPEKVELLSPARNLECGIAAVDHGADAVYIGAEQFGARKAAGNSLDDIRQLVEYAHPFGVRVYVTLNTLFYADELPAVQRLVGELYRIGVDALIVQDPVLLQMELPPIPLHASTQMDNRTVEQALWLQSRGYKQIVLARELGLDEIRAIHQAVPDVTLEAFVHGALCVSYSGRCYASEKCFGRSANRGECAQFCRLPFTLQDAQGNTIPQKGRFPLSLRDMNRSRNLEEMLDAGVRSFKIEGRLKDVSYVKNVTAFYRQCLDDILARRTEYVRASLGTSACSFTPNPVRSFTRGFTDYFLHGRTPDLASPETPKSKGQEVGYVKDVRRDFLVVAGTTSFANGDGLCFINEQGDLQGFRVNRADGNHLYPAQMPRILPRTVVYRNFDQEWERQLERPTAQRKLSLAWEMKDTPAGFQLSASAEGGRRASLEFAAEHQLARAPQDQSIRDTLQRLGDTIYRATTVDISFSSPWFVPRSLLAAWRRQVVEALSTAGDGLADRPPFTPSRPLPELPEREQNAPLMTCRFCLRYQNGWCARLQKGKSPYAEPFYLLSQDGRRFRLHFDCKNCHMEVHEAEP